MQIYWTEQSRAGRGLGMTITYDTEELKPFGQVLVGRTARGICFLGLPVDGSFEQAVRAMLAYFPMAEFIETREHAHNTVLDIYGTDMQISVWKELLKIPEGETRSYKDIATAVNSPASSRAVANAIGANPVCIYIPCHRVIGSDGGMTGYAWGVDQKIKLLAYENKNSHVNPDIVA